MPLIYFFNPPFVTFLLLHIITHMKRQITLLTFILFSLTSLAAKARTGNFIINGQVKDDKQTGVPFATLFLLKSQDSSLVKGTMTDSLGKFEFSIQDTGQFILMADILGFEKHYSEPIKVSPTNSLYELGTISLVSSTNTLNEVTVVTQKKFIEMQAGKMVINPENSPVSAGSTAYDVLKRSPGVSIDQDQNLTLKGKSNVMIFIDDKPTYMTQEQLTNYLRNMPASQIGTIEIINNPSARYDASGNSGIINIKTKKQKNKGYNGNVRLSAGYGWYEKYNGNLQLNYKNNKLNVFGGYGFNFGIRGDKNYFDRNIPVADGNTRFDQFFENTTTTNAHNFRIGSDFYLSDRTTVGLLFKGTLNSNVSDMVNTTEILEYNTLGFSKLIAENINDQPFQSFTGNLNLAHNFDSTGNKKINVDLDFSPFVSDNKGTFFTRYYDSNNNEILSPQDIRSTNFSDVSIYAGKVDYTQTVSNAINFETGIKSSYVTIDNGINFQINDNGSLIDDTTRNNDFSYDENINAAYFSLNHQLKKFNYNIGLRTEHTSNTGFSATLDSTVKREYISLFPSGSISWDIDSTNNLSLAYSRRIDRPSYKDLNPFLYFADQYSYVKGNPFLRPQFTNGVSLTHTFMQFLFTTVGADITNDYMGDIIEQDTASKISFMTNTNFKTFSNYYFNISTGAPIKKLFFMINLSGFYNRFYTQYNNYTIDNSQFTYNFFASVSYSFGKNWKFETSGFYNSKAVYGIFKMSSMKSIDMGLKKSFPAKGIDFNLSVSDVFDILENNIIMNDNGIDATFSNKWETRVARLTFTWNFGKQDLKPRKRKTATEEEQQRVQKGGGGMGK